MKRASTFFAAFLAALLQLHAQEMKNENPVPVHFIKFDVLKLHFCQLHLDYERYNGKHSGQEIGFSWFLPNPVYAYINENQHASDLLKYHYYGPCIELKQKFYLPLEGCAFYAAPQLSYAHQYFSNAAIYFVDEFHSSSYTIVERVGARREVWDGALIVGFITNRRGGMAIDINFGAGYDYYNLYTRRLDRPLHPDEERMTFGHSSGSGLVYKCSFKLCFGFKPERHA